LSSALEICAFGSSQFIRLASSIILTRLLLLEDYGLSATVSVFVFGLVMLSDMGLHSSFVRSKNSDKPRFANTMWTMQIVRGCMLWIIACLLAKPFASYFEAPALAQLIPIGSLTVMLHGFTATNVIRLRRDLQIRPIVLIDMASQIISTASIIIWALIQPTVWALVAGPLIGESFRVIASFRVGTYHKHALCWDKEARQEITHFGKWIMASSSLSFVSTQCDRLLLLKLIGEATLGTYNLALQYSNVVGLLSQRITNGVLFPALSSVNKDRPEDLRDTYYRVRLPIDFLTLMPLGILSSCSQWLIDLLYEEEWSEAGWMMQILCIRTAIRALHAPCESALFASGHTRYSFFRDAARTPFVLIGAVVAFQAFGVKGMAWTICLAELPPLFVLWYGARKHGLFVFSRELLALSFLAVGLGLGAVLAPLLPLP
jgi:O-antigen/teichoic acid export membrane protein